MDIWKDTGCELLSVGGLAEVSPDTQGDVVFISWADWDDWEQARKKGKSISFGEYRGRERDRGGQEKEAWQKKVCEGKIYCKTKSGKSTKETRT